MQTHSSLEGWTFRGPCRVCVSLAGVVAVAKSFPGGVQKESTGLDLVWRRANEEWGEEGGCTQKPSMWGLLLQSPGLFQWWLREHSGITAVAPATERPLPS